MHVPLGTLCSSIHFSSCNRNQTCFSHHMLIVMRAVSFSSIRANPSRFGSSRHSQAVTRAFMLTCQKTNLVLIGWIDILQVPFSRKQSKKNCHCALLSIDLVEFTFVGFVFEIDLCLVEIACENRKSITRTSKRFKTIAARTDTRAAQCAAKLRRVW